MRCWTSRILLHFLALLCAISLYSCSQVSLDDIEQNAEKNGDSGPEDGKCRVTFQIGSIEQMPFDNTRTVYLSDLCTHISVGIFQADTKIKVINQTTTDGTKFGTLSYDIAPGTYQIICIAHNGLGNCTITTPDKITFQGSRVTDTFYAYQTVKIESSTTLSMELVRPVSMFRLRITSPMPENVVQMQFVMTGGSASFNATSGFGYSNSTQKEEFAITADQYGQSTTFELYTFPHQANDFINVTATAVDVAGNTVASEKFENYNIKPDTITQHSTSFFPVGDVSASLSISIKNDGAWGGIFRQ